MRTAFQPKQEQLWNLLITRGEDAATWLGYGGSRGGAKSGAVRRCATALALSEPRIPIWIFRRVFGDLKRDHIDPFFDDFPELREYYQVGNQELVFPERFGSSRISFVYAETKDDLIRKFRGPQGKYIFVDQAEQLTEEELRRLKASNRHPGTQPGDCKMVLAFNPGGPGTEFLRRVFHTRQYRDGERPSDYAFIQAYGWDNYEWFRGLGIKAPDFYEMSSEERFALFVQRTDYGRNLNSLPASLRMGELLGSFDSFSGQYFADVWDEKCILSPKQVQQIVKPWWTRWMAQDWAFWEHTAHGWFASGKLSPAEWVRLFGGECQWPMDVAILYREYVVEHRAEADLAIDVCNRTPAEERRQISRFFLSQDAFGQRARQQGAHTVGQQYSEIMRRNALPDPEAADQDRVNGWRFMANCLRQANLRGTIFDAERAKQGPALFISADCTETISAIPLAMRDEKDHNDVMRVEGALWEDMTDMVRYGLKSMLDPKSRAPKDVRAKEESARYSDPTARALAMQRFEENERRRSVVSRAPRWRG